MKLVFVDTSYLIARVNPKDQWHEAAKKADEGLGHCLQLTTDDVLTEFLGALSGEGKHLRDIAVKMVKAIINNPNVKVVPGTRELFIKGLEFYEKRNDKAYSLVDCISMVVMIENKLTTVLTSDHHFEQEGHVVLMKSGE